MSQKKPFFFKEKGKKKCPVGNTDRKESPYRDNTMAYMGIERIFSL